MFNQYDLETCPFCRSVWMGRRPTSEAITLEYRCGCRVAYKELITNDYSLYYSDYSFYYYDRTLIKVCQNMLNLYAFI